MAVSGSTVYLCGTTQSPDFSLTSALQKDVSFGGSAFIARIDDVTTADSPFRVLSSASYMAALSPEGIMSVFGASLTQGTTEQAPTTDLPLSLAGVQATLVDSAGVSRSVPLYYASPTQLNVALGQVAPGLATLNVTTATGTQLARQVYIRSIAPALFTVTGTGQGPAAAVVGVLKADGQTDFSLSYECSASTCAPTPIDVQISNGQVFLALFGTGIRGRSSVASVRASIDGYQVPVIYGDGSSQHPTSFLAPRPRDGPGPAYGRRH
jgi:uncharacterized protein (TIGR03437 family)